MNTQHVPVRLFLVPLFLLLAAAAARAATVSLPANDSLAAAGAWSHIPYCFMDDALYATGAGAANGSKNFRVGLTDPGDTVDMRITNVLLYVKGYSGSGKGKIQLVPFFNGATGTASVNLKFGRTEVTRSFDITPQRVLWHWGDVVNLSVQFKPRTTTAFFVNAIFAVVTCVDTAVAVQRHYFSFDPVVSPETLGLYFPTVIRAMVAPGDTVMSSFNNTAGLTDLTGSVTPSIVAFSAGRCTSQVMIAQDTSATALTVADGDTAGASNSFAVINPGLHHFAIDTIGSQAAGVPFPVAIAALDFYGDTVTSYTDAVDLWDAGGALAPDSSGAFSNGIWLGSVTVPSALSSDTIYCSRTIGGHAYQGLSNGFTFMLGTAGSPVSAAGSSFSVKVYPNPVKGMLGMEVGSPVAGKLSVTVYNMLGQVKSRKDAGVISAGATRIAVTLAADIMPGVYFVEAAVGSRLRQVQKVVIVR